MSTPADLAGVLLTEAISATIPAIITTGGLYWILRTLELINHLMKTLFHKPIKFQAPLAK